MSAGGALAQLVADEGGQSAYLTGNGPQPQPQMDMNMRGFEMKGTTESDPTRQQAICHRFCGTEGRLPGDYNKCMQACMPYDHYVNIQK